MEPRFLNHSLYLISLLITLNPVSQSKLLHCRNYVVQYIIEMEIPSASSKLHSQFKGNYVNLSMQKFSSHVVEKCLMHISESRSRIVQEMLSFPHFERFLPDPYANYVVQRALGVTKVCNSIINKFSVILHFLTYSVHYYLLKLMKESL